MKKITFVAAIILLLLLNANLLKSQTADPLANQKTKCILQYLSSLAAKPNNKVISGQWTNYRGLPNTPATEFDTAIVSINNLTSKWVGIIGTNYMRQHTAPSYSNFIDNHSQVNQPLINYDKQNGLSTVMLSWNNPWNGGGDSNLGGSTNLLDCITNGHPANTALIKDLDSIAVGFSQLQDSGVTVLFRPFHEMNGNWFWYGSKSTTLPIASDFTALWQYTFNYLTVTKNLHNILWYYCPSARPASETNLAFKTELFYYPGNNYVDVIGLDVYNDTLSIPNYTSIIATGKPVGIAEFGPKKATVANMPFVYDYTRLINQIRNKYPALCHWISWNHMLSAPTNSWYFFSLSKQNNTTALLNDSWVITRDEIDYTTTCTGTGFDSQFNNKDLFKLYPQPADHIVHLQFTNAGSGPLKVFNTLGEMVFSSNEKLQEIDVSQLQDGLYFVEIGAFTTKLIIKH